MSTQPVPLFSDFVQQRQAAQQGQIPNFSDFVQQRISQSPPIAAAPIPQELQRKPQPTWGRDAVSQKSGYGSDYDPNETTEQALSKFVRSFSSSAGAAGGAEAGAAIGSMIAPGPGTAIGGVLGSLAGYTLTDQTYARLKNWLINSKDEDTDIPTSLANAVLNEAGSKALTTFEAGVAGYKGQGLTTAQKGMSDLGATFSQHLQSLQTDPEVSPVWRKVAKLATSPAQTMEDLFAHGRKLAAQKVSGTLGEEALEPQPNSFGGDDPNKIADTVQALASLQRKASYTESNQQALIPKIVAKTHTVDVQIGQEPDTLKPNFDYPFTPITVPGAPIYKTVEGPIHLNSVSGEAARIVQNAKNAALDDPSNAPLVNVAQRILDSTQNGKNPINFSDAWDLKQEIGENSGWGKFKKDETPQDRSFRKLGFLMNDDIDNSIPNWQPTTQPTGPVITQTPTLPIQNRIYNAIKQSDAGKGNNVTFYQLMKDHPELADISKADFDKTVVQLQNDGHILLNRHYANYSTTSEPWLVNDSTPQPDPTWFNKPGDFGMRPNTTYTSAYLRNPSSSGPALPTTHPVAQSPVAQNPLQSSGAKQAMAGWQLAKATVEQRNLTFNPEHSGSENLSNLIENANTSLPSVNATLLDSKQLQRALNAGEQQFPSGKIPAPNARLVYQAANDVRIRDLAKTKDPITGQYRIDPQLVTNAWDDPKFAASRDILYNSQQDGNMSQLYKQIAITQQKTKGFAPSSKLWMGTRGIMLAAPLVSGALTGHTMAGLAVSGFELGAMGFAKAMTNQKLARAMIAAAAGQPLSMSEQNFARMLFGTIHGTINVIVGQDGSRQRGTVDRDGKFTALDDQP